MPVSVSVTDGSGDYTRSHAKFDKKALLGQAKKNLNQIRLLLKHALTLPWS
jgi:hypothetical protein